MFDTLWERYKIKKPIRLIELFAGYGSQHLALKYLGADFESHRIAEWAVKSIQAYKDLHCGEDHTDYSKGLTDEEVAKYLFEKGISADYNKPMTNEQIKRLGAEREREIYNNIKATNNLVSVCNIKAADLEITEKDKYEYIMTYSFPCQDLSLAGQTKGMKKGSGTRSGLLWEVERILNELKERDELPQILLMENVTQVHGTANWEDFNAWKKSLQEMGYCNFWQDLIATDYGIPQTRDRTFMVSILGDYNYEFPKPIKLEKSLKDLLEDEKDVPEKFYLSDKMMKYITSEDDKYKVSKSSLKVNRKIACSKTTREGWTRADTSDYICENLPEETNLSKHLSEMLEKNEIPDGVSYIDAYNRSIKADGKAATIHTRVSAGNDTFIAIKNATKKGYSKAEEGDGVDISTRMEHHRGTVQKGKAQTLSTMGGANTGVVVKATAPGNNGGGVKVIGNYSPSGHNASRIVDPNGTAPTVMENHGTITATVVGTYNYGKSDKFIGGE